MEFTPQQRNAVELHGHLAVTAGAGSGKTRVLVERYVRLLTEYGTPDALLAITFTEKAAREMRDRVRATLDARMQSAAPPDRPRWEALRTASEAARIGTIHSFCATLLRAHPIESGVDPRFRVLDEVESGILIHAALEETLLQAMASGQTLIPLLAEYAPDELRAILNELLRQGGIVEDALAQMPTTPDALVDAWATLGQTVRSSTWETLRSSYVWQQAVSTLSELAPTAPTNDGLADQVRTVVAWLASIEHHHTESPPALPSIKLNVGSKARWGSAETLAEAKHALGQIRSIYESFQHLLHLTSDADLEQRAARIVIALSTIYRLARATYEQRKTDLAALDFDDLERYAARLMRIPTVRRRWRSELRAILVDEFQDTNATQRDIIFALLDEQPHPDPTAPTLFIVGDGKQSIYRFRGAQVSVFRNVVSDIVRLGGQPIDLATSFRSHAHLLSWINTIAESVMQREGELHPFEIPFTPLVAHRPAAPFAHCVEIHLTHAQSAAEKRQREATILAERIKAMVAGEHGRLVYDETTHTWRIPSYRDIAMLFQASTVFDIYEDALRSAGVPYLTTAGRGFYGQKEIRDLINLLRLLDDPSDELALVGVLRSPLFAIDDNSITSLRLKNPQSLWAALMDSATSPHLSFVQDTLRTLLTQRSLITTVELLQQALDLTGYMATISGLVYGERRRLNIEKLLTATRLASNLGPGAFRDYLDQLLRSEPREGEAPLEAGDSVRIMTIHRSKGLEFPIVFLPDLGHARRAPTNPWLLHAHMGLSIKLRTASGEQELPIAYQIALHEEHLMEQAERERLLYVALTRARDYLVLSGPRQERQGAAWINRIIAALGSAASPGDHGSHRVAYWDDSL